MTCAKCGAALPNNSRFCTVCGAPAVEPQAGLLGAPRPIPDFVQAPKVQPPIVQPPIVPQTSGKAIASLICGLVMVFPFFIFAVIFGHLALSDIRRSAGRLKGHGMAIAGLVLGYSAIPLVLIFAAIAIPNLLRAKIFANEASAVGNVRNIVSAEISYQTAHPQAGFTCDLSDLSGLLDSDLVSGQKHGYVFALQNCTAEKGGGPASHFHITASPVTYNATGVRAFCADESGVTRSDNTGSAQGCLEHGSPLE